MPKVEPVTPVSKISCPSCEELRQYLAGWIEEAQAADIDTHLQSCDLCNRSLKSLESHPETLLQSLQSTVGHSGGNEQRIEQLQIDELDLPSGKNMNSSIDEAFQKAKKLIHATGESMAFAVKPPWGPALKELGIYDLIRPLGRGGMGAVYLAIHRQLRKQVAIKLLPLVSGEDSDVRARFEREIRVVGRLNHPSIVAATDAGEIDGTQFLVMEYVPGLDLSRLARLMGRLPVADACELIRQVAMGLSCAHAEGVVHRDVKPSNLMLDESGRIRILDFGLAQLSVWDEASVDLTTVGQLMGTLDYMAPEQAELSGSVDYRADLYALGATLFRLLCGRPPLAAAPNQSPLEKLRLLATQQPPKLDTLCPESPTELVRLVASLLSRNPQDRPASAAHVAEQLAPFAEGSGLVELLEQAKQRAASAPEPVRKSPFDDVPAFLPYATASVAPPAMAPQPAKVDRGRRNPIRRLLFAVSLPLLIIAGILIKLETSKGQLIIESEVDNVTVKLVKNGKPLEGLQISHGTTSTRLQADQYEIIIDGASDGMEIVNNQFTLRSGETVVARIQQTAASPEPAPAIPLPSRLSSSEISVPADPVEAIRFKLLELDVERQLLETRLGANHPQVLELKQEIEIRQMHLREIIAKREMDREITQAEIPLYDGKPLDHWLDMLSREKSAAGLKTAFEACSALATSENGEKIADVVLKIVPGLNGESSLGSGSLGSDSTVDWFAEQLLRTTLPGPKFCSRWVAEFEAGETAWRARLWKSYRPGSINLGVEEVEPFVVWAEQRLARPAGEGEEIDQDSIRAADALRNMIAQTGYELTTEAFRVRVVGILKVSPQLPVSWWLSQPLVHRTGEGDHEIWPTEFKVEVIRRAIEALGNDETPSSLVIQASIILANSTELNAEQQQKVTNALNRRLDALAKDRSMMTQFVKTAEPFTNFSIPATDTQSPLYQTLQIEVRRSYVREIPVIENSLVLSLLNHSWKLDKGLSAKLHLDQMFRATQGTFDRIQTQATTIAAASKENAGVRLGGFRRPSRPPVHLIWPDLQAPDNGGFLSDSGPVSVNQLATATLWGKHEPSKQDWLEYLILLHPVMTERVTQAVKEFPATPTVESAPVEKTE
ncbi:MAG: serine/threonine-protein kinase [Planctomycetaceae bacterium]